MLEFPGGEGWVIIVNLGLILKCAKVFCYALESLMPEKTFVVCSGEERHPMEEGIEAFGAREVVEVRILVFWNLGFQNLDLTLLYELEIKCFGIT